MGRLILIILIVTPIIEIAVFIEVGGLIGLWPTLATIVLTALIGTALLRQQGLATLARAQQEMAAQRVPVRELFHGICLLLAGALLLTPGFVTDAVGFALLVPPLREAIGRWLWSYVSAHGGFSFNISGGSQQRSDETIVDADYYEVDPDNEDPNRPRLR